MATYNKFNVDRRLLSVDFDTIMPLLDADIVEATRAVMVDGCSCIEAAERFNRSRQAIYGWVNGVWATYEKYKECKTIEYARAREQLPPDWDIELLAAPEHMLIDFKHAVDMARRKFLKDNAHAQNE
jgi:predicted DNA-binding protein YlxM (UPF0122 family)